MPRSFRENASTALYQAVKGHIRSRIQSGAWKVGERISSEHELVAELKVSRMTIHRALRELAEEGLIQRVAGVGSFVAEAKAESSFLQVANIGREIQGRGHVHRCEVLLQAREAATPEVAAMLGLRTGEGVFHLVCLHREDEVPLQLEDRFVNPAAAPAFLDQAFGTLQPGEYLLETVPLDEVEHVVEALLADAELAIRLEIRPGDPCLVLSRRTWRSSEPVTYVRCFHPASRYRLGSRFKPGGSPGVG